MKRRILLFLLCLMCFGLVGCTNENDHIEVYNKSRAVFDNVGVPIKKGYYYDKHEKFTVDENTIGVTIYFSSDYDDGEW